MARRMLVAVLRGAAVVLGVVTLTFLLLHLAPGDPVQRLLGPAAGAEEIEAARRALVLDRPLLEQYVAWIGQVLQGDFGVSLAQGRPAAALLAEAWPATAVLVLLSIGLSWVPGILVGATGLGAEFLSGPARLADRLRHLALPLTTLTLIGFGANARFTRAAMGELT